MLNGVFVKNYTAPPVDMSELRRYASCPNDDERMNALLTETLAEAEKEINYRLCYRVCTAKDILARFSDSQLVARRLCGVEYAVLVAVTLGVGLDRLIARYGVASPTKALLLQGIGAERVESLLNAFGTDMRLECEAQGFGLGARFSAGYGDFPLTAQRELFALLDCSKTIGLTLTDSCLMSPTKSVTAIFPIGKGQSEEKTGCATCEKKSCAFRKTE